MSLHYILDGYNILQQIPKIALRKLGSDREGLIALLETYRPQGNKNNPVTVVFDGRSEMLHKSQSSMVKIIFSANESADDCIRHIVSKLERKKQTIVVTDDRELQDSVKILGAQILAVKDFLAQTKKDELMPLSQRVQKKKKEEEKYISKTLEYKINNEFADIWLKKNK